MARPRRKVSKQKQQALKEKRKQESTPSSKEEELEKLKQRQRERRRRLLWPDDDLSPAAKGHNHASTEDDTEYEDEYDYYHGYDDHDDEVVGNAEDYFDEVDGNEDEDFICETSCPNPNCKNYSIDACANFQIPSNAFLVRTIFENIPQLTIAKLESKGAVTDIMGNRYGPFEVKRADNRDFLVSCLEPKDLERIIKDEMIVVDGYEYSAKVLPTGTDGDFFRDYHHDNINNSSVNPWFITFKQDLKQGLTSTFASNLAKYDRIGELIKNGRQQLEID